MKIQRKTTIIFIVLVLMLSIIPTQPVFAATLVVDSIADTNTPGTLRYAILNAAPGDTIEFDLSYPATIVLTSTLSISQDLIINGPGQDDLIIDSSGYLAFSLTAAAEVTISDLTISSGSGSDGGAIYKSSTSGTLTLTRVTIDSSTATGSGGAIYTAGPTVVSESIFTGNTAADSGGAIMATGSASLAITTSTFSGNTATANYGGAVYFDSTSTLQLYTSTFVDNEAPFGGAVAKGNASSAEIANSTFYSNTAGDSGGGIYNNTALLNLYHLTLSDNAAVYGAGLYNNATVEMYNMIIANSTAGFDCEGNNPSGSNNLIETGTCTADFSADPMLEPLANNGGPTQTMALPLGSPAIDNGKTNECKKAPVNELDQRDISRKRDGDGDGSPKCDLGSYEAKIYPVLSISNTPSAFTGAPQAAVVISITSGTASSILYDGLSAEPTDIGTYAVTADFTPDDTDTYFTITGSSASDFVIDPELVPPTVDSFTAESPSYSPNIPITAFTASDNVAVTGYLITESSTPPLAGDAAWSETVPAVYTVAGDGSYTLYPWAKDYSGNVSAVFGSPASVTVTDISPYVEDSLRADSNPTNAASVDFTVTFSEAVTGVDITNFDVTTGGSVSGASVSGVSGSGDTWVVSVDTGTGDGTIRLDVLDDNTILDSTAYPLDGGFTSGEAYDIDKTAPDTTIDSQPVDPTADTSASFEFSSPDDADSYECQLDESGFAPCVSPAEYTSLADGEHTFDVRALDAVGNADLSPASYTWEVDTTPPAVSEVTRVDANPTNGASVDFTVVFSESVTGVDADDFTLTVGGSVIGASVSGVTGSGDTYTVSVDTGTGDGTIRLDVLDDDTIVDQMSVPLDGGYTSGETYDIDKTAPDTTIDTQPDDPTEETSAIFEFSSPDDADSYECQLDESGFAPCASPVEYTGLSDGDHTFEVRALDALGNADPTPASVTWTVSTISFLFQDDFETNDLSLWTRYNDGDGWLYTCEEAMIHGTYGACVERGDNDKRKQLIDDTPIDQTVFAARFNFDINSLSMGQGERFRFMQFKTGPDRPAFLVLIYSDGTYYIQLNVKDDVGVKTKTGWIELTDEVHTIEVDWAAATSDGANDGFTEVYIDDFIQDSIYGIDNDTWVVESFRMGFTSKLAGKSISGIFYIDDVATSNSGHIGLP